MSKRSFTLIELVVSIALTAIVVLFLYRALATQNISNEILMKKSLQIKRQQQLFNLLYRDISEANSSSVVHLFNKDYNLLYLQTKNSLHDIPFPYVVYFVHSKDKTLVRLESAYPIKLPLDNEKVAYVFTDALVKHTKKFRVFQIKSKTKEKRPILPGEKPSQEENVTKNKSNRVLLFLQYGKNNLFFEAKQY